MDPQQAQTLGLEAQVEHPRFGQVHIRALRPDDVDLLDAHFQSYSPADIEVFHPHPFDRATAEHLAGSSATDDQNLYLLMTADCESRELAIAYGMLMALKDPRPILGIGIPEAYQDRGLGTILMRHLIECGRRLGRAGLRLTVYADNTRAYHLYQNVGFRLTRVNLHMELSYGDDAPAKRLPGSAPSTSAQ